jgi:hypothetical protein
MDPITGLVTPPGVNAKEFKTDVDNMVTQTLQTRTAASAPPVRSKRIFILLNITVLLAVLMFLFVRSGRRNASN